MNEKIAASCSIGALAPWHDLYRSGSPHNVDASLTADNIVLLNTIGRNTIEDYTNAKLDKSFQDYMSKTRGKKAETYSQWHKENGRKKGSPLAYEIVLQYGEHDTIGQAYYDGTEEDKKKLKAEFTATYQNWLNAIKEKFPHCDILYAALHFDEPNGTPHMHVCFQPIITDGQRGPKEQVSISKALELDGIPRQEKRQEGKNQGFQLSRMMLAIERDIERPYLEALGYTLKDVQHGIKHQLACDKEATEKAVEARKTAEKRLHDIMAVGRLEAKMDEITASVQKAKEAAENRSYDYIERIPEQKTITGKVKRPAMIAIPEDVWEQQKQVNVGQVALYEVKSAMHDIQSARAEAQEKLQESEALKKAKDELVQERKRTQELQKLLSESIQQRQMLLDFIKELRLFEKLSSWIRRKRQQEFGEQDLEI